ncbi:MAG: shikimate dehydrogenase [Oscillospiraceae bacterium]|nr:shikimate dehydrogenase [Oscillospiraceae bacterium]
MKKFGLIGHPLGHSLSPQIHKRLFELSGLSEESEYTLNDIAPEELSGKYAFLDEFEGINVTIPHKIAIIDYCSGLSEGAKRYRSVNCVRGGDKMGFNTDAIGFTKSIEMLGASLSSRVTVIGCGGVGRMICIEAACQGAELTIAALEKDLPLAEKVVGEIKAQNAGAAVKIEVIKGGALDSSDGGDLLINATPVGMFPKVDAMPCTEAVVQKFGSVFDVIYNPKETMLLNTARRFGKKSMSGTAMLVLQAVAAHEIWYGAKFEKSDIDKLITDTENLI